MPTKEASSVAGLYKYGKMLPSAPGWRSSKTKTTTKKPGDLVQGFLTMYCNAQSGVYIF
ncbi:hypothetical protein [Spirosoma endbachense]|uniref:Uncharacterized protein n=1 Tax=Spirosoma endbachense TaxID=2666025 RepID=A0A6P1W585_9BACT|nr:hypothetical protein [Spirosoma endbachense]QHW00612.1 hypothetical protein GJR95_38790 [Spirosoma endbachense]